MDCSYVLLFFLLAFLTSNSTSQSMAQTTDREILLTINKQWGSPSALSSWSPHNNSYCSWAGVSCNTNGQVTKLSLPNLNISNPIPTSICTLQNLSDLDLSYNYFTGKFPTALYGCSSLQYLDLSNNLFSGALPTNMSGFANLTDLDLAGNQISGSIPPSIRSLKKITYLNLSSNMISGAIPKEVGLLPMVTIIDLSNNQLSGNIPYEFDNLHLTFLNLSSNQLTGYLPDSLLNPAYAESFLGNRHLCVDDPSLNMHLPMCGIGLPMPLISMTVIFMVVGCIVIVGTTLCIWIWRYAAAARRKRDVASWNMTPFREVGFTERDIIRELREENVIGSGGAGKVYRVPLRGGAVVAVKKLWSSKGRPEEKLNREFDAEVRILGEIRHANIVSLLCYISSDDTRLLVCEYMENGSLDRWLRPAAVGGAVLDWPRRLRVAIDVARGLTYMHEECAQPVMHRDVKSSNILLDLCFRAKIADFGLARIRVNSGEPESVSVIGGTFGYMAPECGRGARVNEKVDVYSFGVVLLELVTGQAANDSEAEWAWRRYKAGGALHDVVDTNIQDSAVHGGDTYGGRFSDRGGVHRGGRGVAAVHEACAAATVRYDRSAVVGVAQVQ
ncbi:unnamed protein product [Urochloa humidicola]